MGTGYKTFARGSLGVIMGIPLSFLPYDFWTCELSLQKKQYSILNTDSAHIQSSRESCSIPARYCHLASTLGLQKATPLVCQTSCFRVVGNMVSKLIPWAWTHWSASFAVKRVPWSAAMLCCSTVVVEMAFCKSTSSSNGRSIVCKQMCIQIYPYHSLFLLELESLLIITKAL